MSTNVRRALLDTVLLRTFLLAAVVVFTGVVSARGEGVPQLRLADDLGFPDEGYCIDVIGVGQSARADLPLIVHNCLPERGSVDRMAVLRDGRIEMPAFDACVTAFGVRTPLPGAPVILRPCGIDESFLPVTALQRFERTEDGQLRLANTDLCLVAGPDAAPTFSASHRWRTLTLERCAAAPPALSVWE
ncbi:MAG: hypothetical protein AAF416_13030 [Pseudomonadota bacterium]